MQTTTTEVAPHGGTLIETETDFVEISVFEKGVPPQFRLYFYDVQRRPKAPRATTVSLETLRPDGTRQDFDFVQQGSFLKSVQDIPEPHEFDVAMRLSPEKNAAVYRTRFTEAAHGHDHAGDSHAGHGGHDHGEGAHGHSHAPGDHDHDHGKGIFGWLRGTFAHSHAAADKVDETLESNERGIAALKISLVGLLITASLQLVVVYFSHSVALLADMIHNFGDATTSIPLWFAFSLAKRGASRRFTYGYGKVEDVAGVAIVAVIFFSACVAAYEAVMKILHPQPMLHLWWVALAAVIGFAGNEIVAVFRIRTGKAIGSAALVADGMHARVDGYTSLAVLVGVVGAWLGFPLVDPLVGVLITVAILFIVKDAAVSVFNRMVERIEPEILQEVEHAPTHIPGVLHVEQARARWVGHRVFADLQIAVDPDMSVKDARAITDAVQDALKSHVPSFGEAIVHVRPGSEVTVST